MLVVAPLVMIFIGVIIVAISTLTGNSLRNHEQNTMQFQVQDTLDTIDSESARSISFPSTTGTLTSPQGQNNSTTGFSVTSNDNSQTDTDTLIITTPATTTSPLNPIRDIVYYNSPNSCSALNVDDNNSYPITTVYFVASGSLWQRTILPNTGTPCSTPWQRSSCATSQSLTGVCKTYDSKLVDNITEFSVQYLSANGTPVASTNPSAAAAVSLSITASKSVAGETISYAGSTRSVPINSEATYAIGDVGPAGGKIFYDAGTKQSWGRYMEAAPQSWNGVGFPDAHAPWGCQGIVISGADGVTIGTGKQNTQDIINGCAESDTAARLAASYNGGGKTDWFLPSEDELHALYTQKAAMGDLFNVQYWSSTETTSPDLFARTQDLSTGAHYFNRKAASLAMRPVRAF